MRHPQSHAVLLRRYNLVCVVGGGLPTLADNLLQAAEIEFAKLGYVMSSALQSSLARLSPNAFCETTIWLRDTLARQLGADRNHVPQFRNFPEDIPADTHALWVQRVLSHFLQSPDQPCLFCDAHGNVHVLSPCEHVVCDTCFDGSNYSGCPICNAKVDSSSPFFKPPAKDRTRLAREVVHFKRLELGNFNAAVANFVHAVTSRAQPLSPTDRGDLETVIRELGPAATNFLPDHIPVKETSALLVGTLLKLGHIDAALGQAKARLRTATDVLRTIAVMSGADASLQGELHAKPVTVVLKDGYWRRLEKQAGLRPSNAVNTYETFSLVQNHRFKVAKLRRPVRRALLSILENFDADRLVEDMLRHRSYWVWIGEFLHPHEYAKRFPNTARAFRVVRKRGPDGSLAPLFQSFYSRLECAVNAGDAAAMLDVLSERPGEFARRLDHLLRIARDDSFTTAAATDRFIEGINQLTTPMLLSLRTLLATRSEPVPVRVFWPKGGVASGVIEPDKRQPLSTTVIDKLVGPLEAELLERFVRLPFYSHAIVDEALQQIVVPFNERTAAKSAVELPRGSVVPIDPGPVVRLFLHWCQPKKGPRCDLDLSIGLYDGAWNYKGVCSYYELTHPQGERGDAVIALSSGDFTSAPFPDGATEFVDVHRSRAAAQRIRYVVMVVTAYSGLPFNELERAFAGLMIRNDVSGRQFDPRTIKTKFELRGLNGIFVPLVFDLETDRMHWLDIYAKGQFAFNNVDTSNKAIQFVCPSLMTYFSSGQRASMFDLALLHAAARCQHVHLRDGEHLVTFKRRGEETANSFLNRLRNRLAPETVSNIDSIGKTASVLACLYDDAGIGDLADGSAIYTLFRSTLPATLSASDLLTN